MGRLSFWQWFKKTVSSAGWRMFLWGNDLTAEQYWKQIKEQP